MKTPPSLGSRFAVRLRRSHRFQTAVLVLLTPGLLVWDQPLQANPHGGVVVHGDVNIGAGAGGHLQILQGSQSAIIDWQGFSIAAGELTQFLQPGSNAAVLNRVTGGDPSAIHGALQANGNVFLINPSGILVGPSGSIDVHGLVLSTLDVDNGEFLAGGDMVFKNTTVRGNGVTNLGRINAIGGDVFLIGRTVSNSGSVKASQGRVGLAAGEEVLLKANTGLEGERVFVRATGAGASGTGIYNDGTIEGAAVELKAHGNLYALAINNKGSVRATGATHSGGRVFLRGAGGSVSNSGSIRATGGGAGSGGRILIEAAYAKVDGQLRAEAGSIKVAASEKVELGGTVDVSALSAPSVGGSVIVEAREIEVGSTALVDASGTTGGGNIQIGGGFQGRNAEIRNADRVVIDDGAELRADAVGSGSGGNVIVWSDGDTEFAGSLSARGVSQGGFAEISGKSTLEVSGDIDLTASAGSAGTLLLDPTNITISATGAGGLGGSTISNVWLSQQLDAGNNVVISTNFGSGPDAGHITVGRTDSSANAAADRIEWYQDSAGTPGGTLTFLAMGDIRFNTSVRSAGAGGINVVAGWDGTTGWTGAAQGDFGSTITFDMKAVMDTMPGGDFESLSDAAGLNGGSIYIGATGARIGVEVGSRFGATNVAAANLFMTGSTTVGSGWAMLGFHDTGYEYQVGNSINGLRNEWWGNGNGTNTGAGATLFGNVQGKNYIALLGGTEYAGGAFKGAGYGATGAIDVALAGRLDMRGGTTSSYTQIGHGGMVVGEPIRPAAAASLTTRDEFAIDSGIQNNAYFGSTWRTNYLGNAARVDASIRVVATGDILLLAAPDFDNRVGGVPDEIAINQTGTISSHIGHGGYQNSGSFHGDIEVIARGATAEGDGRGVAGAGIQLRAGRASGSFAQIGHALGNTGNARSIWDQSRSGNIKVEATTGAIRLLGLNQAPRVGDLNTGALVDSQTSLAANNASDNAYAYQWAQIGHGGASANSLAAGGSFKTPTGTAITNVVPNAPMWGNIDVFAGGTIVDPADPASRIGIQVKAGNAQFAYGMIGHGGANFRGDATLLSPGQGLPSLPASTGYRGNIKVEATQGDIVFTGGEERRSASTWGWGYNFAMLGHGGQSVLGNKDGTIEVRAGSAAGAVDGDILFTAGRMRNDFAQLGHGGESSGRGNGTGIGGPGNSAKITVNALGDIRFVSPEAGAWDAYGLSADYRSAFPNGGTWSVDYRYAMLGHGGSQSHGSIAGDIEVSSGGAIVFRSGDSLFSHSQIGHGGYSTAGVGVLANAVGFSGKIDVWAAEKILFVAGTLGRRHIWEVDAGLNYTQIGHGGYNGDVDQNRTSVTGLFDASGNPVGHNGDIIVRSGGSIEFLAGDATRAYEPSIGQNDGYGHYAQIGHGGISASGNHYGNIEVKAGVGKDGTAVVNPAAGIQFAGGAPGSSQWADHYSYAQLGHGGRDAVGNHGRRMGTVALDKITVLAGGDISFTAGSGIHSYAMLGHGGYGARGDHAVNIDVRAGGDILFAAGEATLQSDAGFYGQYSWANGTTVDANTHAFSLDWAANLHAAYGSVTATPTNGVAGRVRINSKVVPGTIKITVRTTTGLPTVLGTFSDDGNGNLVADEDFLPANYNDGLGTRVITKGTVVGTINYVLHNTTTTITFLQDVNPGTSDGTANLAIEFQHWGVDNAFAQLGNGGYEADNPNNSLTDLPGNVGNIDVRAGGDVVFKAGNGAQNYAQLGHGGYVNYGANTGYISVGAADDRVGGGVVLLGGQGQFYDAVNAYVQIGHGGRGAYGTQTGKISIYATSGIATDYDGIGLHVQAGTREENYAQVGHGGRGSRSGKGNGTANMEGNTGDIYVDVVGDVNVVAGVLNRGGARLHDQMNADGNLYAQIGHGGYDADVSFDGVVTWNTVGHNGDITVISREGSVNVLGGDHLRDLLPSFAPVAGIHDGWAIGGIPGVAGIGRAEAIAGGRFHYAMIGHGGYEARGNHYGSIDVRAGFNDAPLGSETQTGTVSDSHIRVWGGIMLPDDGGGISYAQIGHGGRDAVGDQGRANEVVSVMAAGDVQVHGGAGTGNYAQLGNGGYATRGDHKGRIQVSAGRDVSVRGGKYSLDENGGRGLSGQYTYMSVSSAAALDLNFDRAGLLQSVSGGQPAGRVVFTGVSQLVPGTVAFDIYNDNGVRIGSIEDDGTGILRVVDDFTEQVGGDQLVAGQQVGIVNYFANWVEFTVRVNPGTPGVGSTPGGVAVVNGADPIPNIVARFEHILVNQSYAQIGHGGYDSDNSNGGAATVGNEGDILVHAGRDVLLQGGGGANTYAQIGHGGHATSGRDRGKIEIGTAARRVGGGVVMLGGRGDYYASHASYVQIGHGGHSATGTKDGDIFVYATTANAAGYGDAGLHLQAGTREENYAQVGHGGTNARSGTANDVAGAEGNRGNIVVDVVGDVNVVAGVLDRGGATQAQSLADGNLSAQIGHGGYNADAALNDAPANIWTGGATTGHRGDITVISREGSVNVLAGDHLRDILPSFGPAGATNPYYSLYDSLATDGITTRTESIAGGRHHYAMIGHGGVYVYGNHWGSIDVRAGFNDAAVPVQTGGADSFVRVRGGRSVADQDDGLSFAMIGHGGRSAVGNQGRDGDKISVRAVGDVEVHGGSGIDAYAMIGNGGAFARGDHRADILVSAGGNLSAIASQVSSDQPLVTRYAHNSIANATELNSNTDRAGLVAAVAGGNPAGRLTLRAVNGVIPGSVWIEIYSDAGARIGTIEDDGTGTLRVVADFTEQVGGVQLVAGQAVGTVNYAANWLEFTTRVNPGAQDGAMNVVVNLQHLAANRAFAQIGNGGYDADNPDGGTTSVNATMYTSATGTGNIGNIDLFAGGDVILKGGAGGQTYAQFGHGGMYNTGRNVGNITLGTSANRIGGGVIMQGGAGEHYDTKNSYVQIGHGGFYAMGTQTGNIDIYASSGLAAEYAGIGLQVMAGTREDNYAMVGHGGVVSRSGTGTGAAGMEGHNGNITVDVVGDVNVIGGVLDRGGATLVQFGDDGRLSAQIGHGGYDSDATLDGATAYNTIGHNGAIKVISQQGSVNVLAGDHLRALLPSLAPTPGIYDGYDYLGVKRMDAIAGGRFHWAMIGHGGYESRGNHYGDITVHAGFNNAAVQTGIAADSSVRVWGGIYLHDQDASIQFAQIGHGGFTGIGNQGRDGEVISVMAAGDVQVHGGDGVNNYAQIGNGGYGARGDHKGDVQVFAGGDVSVVASQYDRNRTPGNGIPVIYQYPSISSAGALNVNLDRATLLQSVVGGNAAGVANFSGAGGSHVILGTLAFDVYNDAGVLIGTVADADGSGVLRVVANFTELVGGAQLVAGQQVGTVNYGASQIIFTTRINPGLPGGTSTVGGAVDINQADPNPNTPNIVARFEHVTTERAYAVIGHGGYDADEPNDNTATGNSGNIRVTALGNIVGRGGTSLDSYAQFGHGGRSTKGANIGDVILRAGGDVEFTARGQQGQNRAYVQVGHGGYEGDGNHVGDVIVSAGSGALNTSLGTGLYSDLGDFDRDGSADAIQFAPVAAGQGSVTLTGGTFSESYVQIGHGGYISGNTAGNASTLTGQVGVEANGDITLQGGGFSAATGTNAATGSYVQIGHGGLEGNLNMTLIGNISVVSQTGKLDVLAGNGSEAYALVGHGSLRTTVTNVPSGTRTGHIYVEAGSWNIVPNGTNQARIGHRSQTANNGVAASQRFTLIGHGGDGTTSHLVDGSLWSLIGAADHLQVGGDATIGGVDLTMDLAISANSTANLNLLATGDLDVRKTVQNSGTGAVSAVAGWDGTTGMTPGQLDFLQHVPMRVFDIAPVIATDGAWGNNGGIATIGDGTQTAGIALGSARGTTTVLGHAVEVLGSGSTANGYALIGAVPAAGVQPTGNIVVKAKEGGVTVEGGDAALAYAQIGHRALGAAIPALTGAITVESLGDLALKGGNAVLTSAQIGHGANSSTSTIDGAIAVKVAGDIDATGGAGGGAYSQVGHGGLFANGNMGGAVTVDARGDIHLLAPNLTGNAYAKIGHGDDVRGTSASLGGTGDRAGNIELTSGESIEMQSALVGHVNGDSSATPVAGSHTWIALVDENGELLIDPSAGNLIADATSEFSGADEVRLYVPRRANNQVAAGAKINGFAYDGGVDDPQLVQRPDEYTNHWIDGENGTSGTLGQRDTLLGSGPDPVVSAGYAFYYDLIEIGTPPPVVPTDPGAGGNSGGGSAGGGGQAVQRATDYRRLVPDDRTRDEWRRKQEREYSRWGDYGIYYEGYSQYGLHGESVYDWKKEKAEEEGAED